MGSKVVAFIHAKGTSKRLPGKNMADLGGQPLFTHAIQAALNASNIDRVMIDSDDGEILRVGAEYGAQPLPRPKKLATNATTGDDLAVWQASNAGDAAVLVQVVPTSPFIRPETIDNAVVVLFATGVESVAGVRREKLYLWRNGRPSYPLPRSYNESRGLPTSNDLLDTEWETTGLYAARTSMAQRMSRRLNEYDCVGIQLSRIEAIDINTQEDLEYARIVWAGMKAGESCKM